MIQAAVESGLLDDDSARALSRDEIAAALAEVWVGGEPNQGRP